MKKMKTFVALVMSLVITISVITEYRALDINKKAVASSAISNKSETEQARDALENLFKAAADNIKKYDIKSFDADCYKSFVEAMINADFVLNDHSATLSQYIEVREYLNDVYEYLINYGMHECIPATTVTTVPNPPTCPESTERVPEMPPTEDDPPTIPSTEDDPPAIPSTEGDTPTLGPGGIINPNYTILGDADRDNRLTIMDATTIQLYLAKLITIRSINCAAANVTKTGTVSIMDATSIQRKLAGFKVNW